MNRTEMKILVYKKVQKGMSYDEAVKELSKEIKDMDTYAKSSNKEKGGNDDKRKRK